MRTGPLMTFLVNYRNKLLMHITMAYVMLGHNCFAFGVMIFVVVPPKNPATSFAPLVLASAQDVDGTRVRLVCIGVKGDWPFLRKVS